ILVRGCNHAHVHADCLARTDWLEALLLQHAKHFRLRAQAHVADFVEKQRAAIGLLELSNLVVGRAREAALHMAEEFRLDQLLGDRRTIRSEERRVGKWPGAWGTAPRR